MGTLKLMARTKRN